MTDNINGKHEQSTRRNRTRSTKESDCNNAATNTRDDSLVYPPHWSYQTCLDRYANPDSGESVVIRGTLRVMPSAGDTGLSFVTCDRGRFQIDVLIPSALERNRAMHNDIVFVEVISPKEGMKKNGGVEEGESEEEDAGDRIVADWNKSLTINENRTTKPSKLLLHDDIQAQLWNPVVADVLRLNKNVETLPDEPQYQGRVVHVLRPKPLFSELQPTKQSATTCRRLVGSLKVLSRNDKSKGSGDCHKSPVILLTPNVRTLPQFKCPASTYQKLHLSKMSPEEINSLLVQAEYEYGSWQETQKWPPCIHVRLLGDTFCLEDQIQAIVQGYGVDHGEFDAAAYKDVDNAVKEGRFVVEESGENLEADGTKRMDWKPTPNMYKGRRDYRNQRIFTIDPTTAKDLDDAVHIRLLENNQVEVGVHIADVSYFLQLDTAVDRQAQLRSTTVYLVDRTIPMLPRPLCEIACSLNENVERLAMSCVWTMNLDGTMSNKDVWYGRSVIKSCARLDYATAQNIIDGKCAVGETESELDESLWPCSRRPTGGHTIDQVAADVRLMHRVAMARRKIRFDHGALALNAPRLAFQLARDGMSPALVAPYITRDSNRLIEEYMLLANFLVAQRLITHSKELAVLRRHGEPLRMGLDAVVELAKEAADFDIDTTSSQALQKSLIQLGRQSGELLLQCVTSLIMTPMVSAEYFVASTEEPERWRHYALNIPYYTHFTSPIRRYPDVLVHRLLQATLEGESAVKNFPMDVNSLQLLCDHSNDKKTAAREAQERCDRVFLSLHLKDNPMKSEMGIVLSVGRTAFTVYVPKIGSSALLFLKEHEDWIDYEAVEQENGSRRLFMQRKNAVDTVCGNKMEIKVFEKVKVTVVCKETPPIDVKLVFEGLWET